MECVVGLGDDWSEKIVVGSAVMVGERLLEKEHEV